MVLVMEARILHYVASRGVWRLCIRATKQRSVFVILHHESDEGFCFFFHGREDIEIQPIPNQQAKRQDPDSIMTNNIMTRYSTKKRKKGDM